MQIPTSKFTDATPSSLLALLMALLLLAGCSTITVTETADWDGASLCSPYFEGGSLEASNTNVVDVDARHAIALITLAETFERLSYETSTAVLLTDDGGKSWSDVTCLVGAATVHTVVEERYVRVVPHRPDHVGSHIVGLQTLFRLGVPTLDLVIEQQ